MSLYKLIQSLNKNNMPEDDVEYLYYHYQDISQKIYDYTEEITKLKNEQKEIYKQITNCCSHKWVIDRSNVGEHTEWICEICGVDK